MDKFESNLLDTEEISESEDSVGEKQKEQEASSIQPWLDKKGKATDETTGEASNEDPKGLFLRQVRLVMKLTANSLSLSLVCCLKLWLMAS